jgi:Subtilase family
MSRLWSNASLAMCPSRARYRGRPGLRVEELESRTLLSVSSLASQLSLQSLVRLDAAINSPFPSGYTPYQIRHAYAVDATSFLKGTTHVAANGAGQTIGIVDWFNDPTIINDLAVFDQAFGLPAPPSFVKVNQAGGTIYPKSDQGAALEISLDVEWAHALAPAAKILLVEATTPNFSDVAAAIQYAASIGGASVISMSFGYAEVNGENTLDIVFTHPGVTYVASSGDSGAPPSYPATSPNVLAVGGTSLFLNAQGGYGSELGWGGSGGGISPFEAQPAYQHGRVPQSSTKRTNPDVAFVGDPNTGVPIYDSFGDQGQFGWFQIGGTSLSAPSWAGLIAIADQGRALAGKKPLGGNQAQTALYGLPATDFHDITSGTSLGTPHYSAGAGYDLVTGRGTPIANRIIPALVAVTPLAPSVFAAGLSTGGPDKEFAMRASAVAATPLVPFPSVGPAVAPPGAQSISTRLTPTSVIYTPDAVTPTAPMIVTTSRVPSSRPVSDSQPDVAENPVASSADLAMGQPTSGLWLQRDSVEGMMQPGLSRVNDSLAVAFQLTWEDGDGASLLDDQAWITPDTDCSPIAAEAAVQTLDPVALASMAVVVGSAWNVRSAESEQPARSR